MGIGGEIGVCGGVGRDDEGVGGLISDRGKMAQEAIWGDVESRRWHKRRAAGWAFNSRLTAFKLAIFELAARWNRGVLRTFRCEHRTRLRKWVQNKMGKIASTARKNTGRNWRYVSQISHPVKVVFNCKITAFWAVGSLLLLVRFGFGRPGFCPWRLCTARLPCVLSGLCRGFECPDGR